jgi:hypothetical protein
MEGCSEIHTCVYMLLFVGICDKGLWVTSSRDL